MNGSCVFSAHTDRRYKLDRHFIYSEINAELVKKCGLDITVAAFKQLVKSTPPAFTTIAGNQKKAPLMRVNVYDINDFIMEG